MNKQHPAIEVLRSNIINNLSRIVSDVTELQDHEGLDIVRGWLTNQLARRWASDRANDVDERDIDREPVFPVVTDKSDSYLESLNLPSVREGAIRSRVFSDLPTESSDKILSLMSDSATWVHEILTNESLKAIEDIKELEAVVDKYDTTVNVSVDGDVTILTLDAPEPYASTVKIPTETYNQLREVQRSNDLIFSLLKRYETLENLPSVHNGRQFMTISSPDIPDYPTKTIGWFWDIDQHFELYLPYSWMCNIPNDDHSDTECDEQFMIVDVDLPNSRRVVADVINSISRWLMTEHRSVRVNITGDLTLLSAHQYTKDNTKGFLSAPESITDDRATYVVYA